MTKKQQARIESLLPNGKPKHLRLYLLDTEKMFGYTAIFSGNWKGRPLGHTYCVNFNSRPNHPQYGVYMRDMIQGDIDRPRYSHLGKKVSFDDLNPECQEAILAEYKDIWSL